MWKYYIKKEKGGGGEEEEEVEEYHHLKTKNISWTVLLFLQRKSSRCYYMEYKKLPYYRKFFLWK